MIKRFLDTLRDPEHPKNASYVKCGFGNVMFGNLNCTRMQNSLNKYL